MYKEKRFSIRPLEEVLADFREARQLYPRVEKIFLADGDALVRKAGELETILDTIRELFPECGRVTCYASPDSVKIRTDGELQALRAKGLTMKHGTGGVEGLQIVLNGQRIEEVGGVTHRKMGGIGVIGRVAGLRGGDDPVVPFRVVLGKTVSGGFGGGGLQIVKVAVFLLIIAQPFPHG